MMWIKRTAFLFILLALILPSAQKGLHIFSSGILDGYFEPSPRPEFSLDAIRSGEYQSKMTPHLERTIGFKEDFTRLFNQVDFTLFKIPHAARIIVGKHNILQSDAHIDAFLGRDFVGKRYIDEKVARLKYLQQYFLEKKGIHLIVVFTPGKGYFYPESIPDRFRKGDAGRTNNGYYSVKLREAGVNLVDFNTWMVQMKDTSSRNLFPPGGGHWSCYGAYLCADSLIRYLEFKLNRAIPRLVLDSLVQEPVARKEDDDMNRVLNLICENPGPPMSYPVFHHVYQDVVPKPAALFISDSYYWTWQNSGIIKNTFSREDMWFYDMEVYPGQYVKPLNTAQINLDSAISRQQVIILMQTNAGYGNLGFGFVDRAYEFYYPGKTRIKMLEDVLRSGAGSMEQLKAKAKARNVPLDAVIREDATYLYNTELKRISKFR